MDLGRAREAAALVFRGGPVLCAYLYGSRARGDQRPDSDVDIAVLLDGSVPDEQHLDLSLAYARQLEQLLSSPVSPVVVLDSAPLRLQGRVLRDGFLLYSADDDARVRFEAATRVRAADFELKAERLDRALLLAHAAGER